MSDPVVRVKQPREGFKVGDFYVFPIQKRLSEYFEILVATVEGIHPPREIRVDGGDDEIIAYDTARRVAEGIAFALGLEEGRVGYQ